MKTLIQRDSSRDHRIDFWRGVCLVGMVSWHLLTHPSYPRWLAFAIIQPFNFVAEGFVLLAGVAVGVQIARGKIGAGRLLRRAGSLLVVNYGLVLFIVLLAMAERRLGVPMQTVLPDSVADVLTLRYQPYLADVLTLFVFLFVAAPLCQAVRSTLGDLALVVLSVGLFFTASAFPLNEHGAFIFNSWQIFFVAGLMLGIRYVPTIGRWRQPTVAQIAVTLVAFATLAAVRFLLAGPDAARVEGWQTFVVFSRKPLTIARVVYVSLEMLLIAQVTLRCWPAIKDSSPVRWITLLGRHSLVVFVASVVLDYVLKAGFNVWRPGVPVNLMLWAVDLWMLYALGALLQRRSSAAAR